MFGKAQSILIVFIDRNRLQLYGGSLSSIVSLDIPTTIISDLDVVDRDALYTLVNQWLKQNNIGGAELVFVLSAGTYFEKNVTAIGASESETEILKFYDTVPFEELSTKVLTVDNKKIVCATNKGYIESLLHAFMLQGHRVVAVLPVFVLGVLSSKRWMDAEMGAYVLKHIETLRVYSIADTVENQNMPAVSRQSSAVPTAKNNPRLMIMVGIFGVLLLVLIFIIFTSH